MTRIWLTSYRANPRQKATGMVVGEYGTFIEAPTKELAQAAATARGIGEVVMGLAGSHDLPRPSRMILKLRRRSPWQWRDRCEFLHALTFLCYVAVQSGVADHHEVLGDQGVLHEAIHCLLNGRPSKAKISERIERLEALVPGWPRFRRKRPNKGRAAE